MGEIFLEQSFKFDLKISSNQAKYEAILVRLTLGHDIEDRRVLCKSECQLVVG